MNRKEMIDILAGKVNDVSKADVGRIYEGLVELARSQLQSEGEFALPGLGCLKVRESKERMARNPKTGEPVFVPAKKNVRFTAYKDLKELLNPPAAQASAPEPPPAAPEPPAGPAPSSTPSY